MPDVDRKWWIALVAVLCLAPYVFLAVLWSRTNDALRSATAAETKADQYDARLLSILERLDAILKRGGK